MGILNVTPDSFSDGGDYTDCSRAVNRAMAMVREGADVIDVGPESTRPGSKGVDAQEQIRRAIPVIKELRSRNDEVCISVDTRDADVAQAAIEVGADIVNDISALRDDDRMSRVLAESGAWVVLMHMRGDPETMQAGGGPRYDDVVREVCEFLCERRDAAIEAGISRERIILDPGIGFGKRAEHNWALLGAVERFVALGSPVLVGASRKGFIAASGGGDAPKSRLSGSIACAVIAAAKGASILRVHDVAETVAAMRVVKAIARQSNCADSAVPPLPRGD
jgi:dihydropteroate synthase